MRIDYFLKNCFLEIVKILESHKTCMLINVRISESQKSIFFQLQIVYFSNF